MTDLRVSTLVTLGVLTWRLIAWGRNKVTPPLTRFTFSPTTVVHLPQKPEQTHLADTEEGQDYAFQAPSAKPLPPPVYSPGPMMSSSTSNKKSTPTLKLDVSCDAEATLSSPLSFSSSTKTQSFSSHTSSRMSMGAKKLYVDLSGRHSARRRPGLMCFILTAPD